MKKNRHRISPLPIILMMMMCILMPPGSSGTLAAHLAGWNSAEVSDQPASAIPNEGDSSRPTPDRLWSFDFRGESLRHVLETVARTTGTDMMYDPGMIEDIIIYKRIREQPMPLLLSEILADTPFDYIVLSSGTMVIVRKVSEEPAYGSFSGKVRDGQTGQPLHGATVILADASGGTSTDRSGIFHLNRMMSGSYRLLISYVGYHPAETVVEIVPDNHVRTEVSLEPRSFSFTPVVIEAHRPDLAGLDNHAAIASLDAWDITGGRRDPIRSLGMFAGLQYGLPLQDIHLQGGRQGEHRIRLDGIPVYNPYAFGQLHSSFSPLAISDVRVHKAGFGADQGSMISGIIDFEHKLPAAGRSGITILGDPVDVNLRGDLYLPLGPPPRNSPAIQNRHSIAGPQRLSEANNPAIQNRHGIAEPQRLPKANVHFEAEPETRPHTAGLSITSSFRTNFWGIYQDPNLQQTLTDWGYVDQILAENLLQSPGILSNEYELLKQVSDIRYLDGHLAMRYEPREFHTIGASVWVGSNRIRMSGLNQRFESDTHGRFLYTRDDNEWQNVIGQIYWDASPGPRSTFSTRAGFSSGQMNHNYHMITRRSADFGRSIGSMPDSEETLSLFAGMENQIPAQPGHSGNNRIDHGLITSEMRYSITPGFRLDTGAEFHIVSSKVDFSEFFFLPTSSDELSIFGTVYTNLYRTFGRTWQLNAGSRLTRIDTHDRLFAEPRISLQYDRIHSSIGYWSAKLAAGIYRQFIHQYDITNVGPTSLAPSFTVWSHASTAEPPKAYHIAGSWIYQPTGLTTIKLEAYHKWEPSSIVSSYQALASREFSFDRSSAEAFSETTRLRARGFSARMLQQLPNPRLQLMLGYDYSNAEINVSQFGRTLPASWNEPHRIQARSIVDIFGPVSLIVNWKSVYGRAWGFRQAYYDYLWVMGIRTIGGQYNFGTPENDRLPAFHQLDLSVRYRPTIGSLRVDVHLDLINVLNRRNVIDWSLKPVGMSVTQPPNVSGRDDGYDGGTGLGGGGGAGGGSGYGVGGDSGANNTNALQDFDITYEIHERTMPGFYPVLRLEIGF